MYAVLKCVLTQSSVKTLGKSLSTFLSYCTVLSMCTVSTSSLLMKHSRNKFLFKHHASGGLVKERA